MHASAKSQCERRSQPSQALFCSRKAGRLKRLAMRWTILLLALVVAGCGERVATTSAAPPDELAGRVPGPPQSCAPSLRNESLRVLNTSTVAFGSGATIYLNHFAGPCPGVAPLNTMIVDVQTDRYCRGDRVRGLEPGAIIAGPTCILGDWIPYRVRG